MKRRLAALGATATAAISLTVYAWLPKPAFAAVAAKPADSLVESMGVAVHLRYWGQDIFDNVF